MKKSDNAADAANAANAANEATKLTLKLGKACRHETQDTVVMACAGMIGFALASLPPGSRKIVRAGLNGIINDLIREYGE